MQGAPAVASSTAPAQMPSFDEADAQSMQGISGYGATTGAQAARAPDAMGAYTGLMQAPDASLRAAGMKGMMEQQAKQAALAQQQQQAQLWKQSGGDVQKFMASGGNLETAKTLAESGNWGKTKGIAVNGQIVDPMTGLPIGSAIPKQATPPNLASDLLIPDGKGGLMVNQALVGAKKQIAQAGAPSVNVNTAAKPMLTELGKGVGEGITNAWTGAQSAVGTLNNVQQMREGLSNAIVGPGANQRVTLSQVGQVLGVNGKDATEQLQNTRMLMQGLARQELSAAGQMKGQGQITEAERGILKRAEAGQINDLTKPELDTLLGALEKTAKGRIATHNQNLQRLRQDPNAAGVAQYMQVDAPTFSGGRGGGGGGLPDMSAIDAELKRRQGGR